MTVRQTVQLCSVLHQTLGPSWVLLFEGHQIYQLWVSPFLSVGTSPGAKFFITWYVRVEAVFCLVQQEGETECYVSQFLTFVLIATLVWQCWSSAWLSQRYRKQGYFAYPLWSPMTSPTTSRSLQINHLCSW